MATTLNALAIILGLFAALATLFPWHVVLIKYQIAQNRSHQSWFFRLIDKNEDKLDRSFKRYGISYYLVGWVWGILWGQKANSGILDAGHQVLRRSYGLADFSLQKVEGVFDRQRVQVSFDEIEGEILKKVGVKPRDLRYLALYLALAAALSALLGLIV